MNVVGAARGVEKIQELSNSLKKAKGSLTAVKCDLTKEEDIQNLFKKIKEKFGGVDVCVNNAGLAFNASLMEGTYSQWKNLMAVNVIAVCLCSQLTIQSMRERGVDDGHIINVSSTAGHKVHEMASSHFYCGTKHALMAISEGLRQEMRELNTAGHKVHEMASSHFYCGTKHALMAISEGLRQEMRELKSHIRISIVSPGLVETEFAPRMFNADPKEAHKFYSDLKCLEAEDIARSVLHIISAPAHVEINEIYVRPTEQLD